LASLKVEHGDDLAVLARGVEGGLVHQVGQVGAGQARRAAPEHGKIDVVAQRNLLGVHAQDGFAALHVGAAHHHAAVETAGAQQGGVEHVGAVGGGHQDYALVGFEAVHLHQQLVEGLLALIVPAAEAGAAMPSHGVDFIDEDDAGGVFLALLEQIAHAAGAHAHEHFHEIRTGNGEEGHAGFAGDGARQQGLAGARRADQQYALGNASAQLLELLRLTQEFDDFLQLFLGFFHAGHVFEGDLLLLRGVQPRAALAEAQGLVAAALHLPHHENPEGENHDERGEIDEDRDPVSGGAVLDFDVDIVRLELGIQIRIVDRDEGMQAETGVLVRSVDFTSVDSDVLDLSFLHLVRNSVKVICCSLRPWPVRTTANNNTTRQMRTTQKINVLILEFTKPPPRRSQLYRRPWALSRFLFRSYSVFPDFENHPSILLRHQSGSRSETLRPHDGRAVGEDRPTPALPQRDTGLLKEGLDLLPAGVPRRLVLIARPPVPQFQGTRQALPIQATHPVII
jgi:hypothetical protein